MPPALRRLSVSFCGELGNSFPDCLENLNFLTLLHLEACLTIRLIRLNSINTNNLKALVLRDCLELSSIGGSQVLSSIQHVDINGCPKLTEVQQQPLVKRGLRRSELSDIQDFNNHP